METNLIAQNRKFAEENMERNLASAIRRMRDYATDLERLKGCDADYLASSLSTFMGNLVSNLNSEINAVISNAHIVKTIDMMQ